MAYSLLYVSKTLLAPADTAAELENITAVSTARNTRLGITGGLMCTGTYFAQLLEGGRAEVEALMERIDADPRHMRPKIIRTADEPRRFAGWGLVYNGAAGFVERQIAPLFSPLPERETSHLALRLALLMEELARVAQV